MNTCEDFEIAIEKRAHLALDGAGAEKLDAHLATCEPCQRFEALVLHTERIMSNSATAAAASVNWDELSANLARTHKGMAEQVTWRANLRALAWSVPFAGALSWWAGDGLAWTLGLFVAVLVYFAVNQALMVGIWRRRRRRLRTAIDTPGELVQVCRADLDWQIRCLRVAVPITFFVGGLSFIGAVAALLTPGLWYLFVVAAFGLFFVVLGLDARNRRLPALLRERQELE
jgi:hypothetical protein